MDKNIKDEEEKNVTKYGEFISSYFAWLNLDKQKKNADKISNKIPFVVSENFNFIFNLHLYLPFLYYI